MDVSVLSFEVVSELSVPVPEELSELSLEEGADGMGN